MSLCYCCHEIVACVLVLWLVGYDYLYKYSVYPSISSSLVLIFFCSIANYNVNNLFLHKKKQQIFVSYVTYKTGYKFFKYQNIHFYILFKKILQECSHQTRLVFLRGWRKKISYIEIMAVKGIFLLWIVWTTKSSQWWRRLWNLKKNYFYKD